MRSYLYAVGSLLLFFFSIVGIAGQAGVQAPKPFPAQQSLEGVGNILVTCFYSDEDAEKDGLSREAIQNDVELKLRQSKIPITVWDVSSRQFPQFKEPGSPTLLVKVEIVKRDGLYAYSLRLDFKQNVLLERDPKRTLSATTYSQEELGTVGANHVAQVRDSVKDLVDKFCIDFLKVNTGKQQKQQPNNLVSRTAPISRFLPQRLVTGCAAD